jgi:hypothetical protein
MRLQATVVAYAGRGLLIEGEPGSGKSSLALALIDRGATLVGDVWVDLAAGAWRLIASPAGPTRGLIEVRNVGLVTMPVTCSVPVALALLLDRNAPRFIDAPAARTLCSLTVPQIVLFPDSPVLALRAEAALARWGLA